LVLSCSSFSLDAFLFLLLFLIASLERSYHVLRKHNVPVPEHIIISRDRESAWRVRPGGAAGGLTASPSPRTA
jgi:hypothetical protein